MIRLWLLFVMILFTLNGCSGFTYNLRAINLGQYGVMITGMSGKSYTEEQYNDLYPSLPTNTPMSLSRFDRPGKNNIPDKIIVRWQLAELKNCDRVHVSDNHPGYIVKSGCEWVPLVDKKFEKAFYKKEFRKSDAYKKSGGVVAGIACSRQVLEMIFEFRDEQLELKLANSATNPWR